jgi:Ulp1 family protease
MLLVVHVSLTHLLFFFLLQHDRYKGAKADELCSVIKHNTTVLVPANVRSNHWVVFAADVAMGTIQVYDSLAQVL